MKACLTSSGGENHRSAQNRPGTPSAAMSTIEVNLRKRLYPVGPARIGTWGKVDEAAISEAYWKADSVSGEASIPIIQQFSDLS